MMPARFIGRKFTIELMDELENLALIPAVNLESSIPLSSMGRSSAKEYALYFQESMKEMGMCFWMWSWCWNKGEISE